MKRCRDTGMWTLLLILLTVVSNIDAFTSILQQKKKQQQQQILSLSLSSSRRLQQPLSILKSTTEENIEAATSKTIITKATKTERKQPGTAQLDTPWEELGFEFRPTNSHVRLTFKMDDNGIGQWSEPELVSSPYIQLHIGATALHYGQACFEGLKAFCHEDNTVHLFRPDENAARMQSSCRRLVMPELPTDTFIMAAKLAVQDNIEFVPPYGSNGALYLRPLLFGSGPRIGLQPADEYTFLLMAIPVGDYYKGGLSKPVHGKIMEDYDRAAPRGVGNVKVAGNYAADLLPNMLSKKEGYPIILYLDAATQTTIDEFSTSNFVGIDNTNKKYVTPSTGTVLPSVTNKSLMQIAPDIGLTVEPRVVTIEEMESFDECLAVGTAVVVTPVGSLVKMNKSNPTQIDKTYTFGPKNEIGTTTLQLYNHIRAIQNGHREDKYNWLVKVD
jgi:branched-chain amino acid aminotransferase